MLGMSVALVGCEKQENSNAGNGTAGQPGHEAVGGPKTLVTKCGPVVYIPAGEFVMGNDHGNPDEAPAHRVKLSAFWMDQHEVTHVMFAQVQLPDPSHWQDSPSKPVERVRWRDA